MRSLAEPDESWPGVCYGRPWGRATFRWGNFGEGEGGRNEDSAGFEAVKGLFSCCTPDTRADPGAMNSDERTVLRLQPADCPVNLFQRFNLSGSDVKGQVSSGYSGKGHAVTFDNKDVGETPVLDLDDVPVAPGLISVDAIQGVVTRVHGVLLVCARLPKALHGSRLIEPVAAPAATPAQAPAIAGNAVAPAANPSVAATQVWAGPEPVVLACLTGTNWSVEASADIRADFDLPEVSIADEFGIGNATVTSAVGTGSLKPSGKIRIIELTAATSTTFASTWDKSLAGHVNEQLMKDVRVYVA